MASPAWFSFCVDCDPVPVFFDRIEGRDEWSAGHSEVTGHRVANIDICPQRRRENPMPDDKADPRRDIVVSKVNEALIRMTQP